MTRINWIHAVLVVLLVLVVLFFIRMHGAFGQGAAADFTAEQIDSGRLYAIGWCTECHSVQPETDRTGKFAPDFTAIARQRSTTARSLYVFLHTTHKIMPDYILKTNESRDIIAYILSLRR